MKDIKWWTTADGDVRFSVRAVSWEPWESHPLSSLAKHQPRRILQGLGQLLQGLGQLQSVPWRQIDVIEVLFMGGMVRMEELREI